MRGPQIPNKIEGAIILIPKIGDRNPTEFEWDDDKTWEEMQPDTFVPLWGFCEETVKDFFRELNRIHGQIYTAKQERYKGCELAKSKPIECKSSSDNALMMGDSSATPSLSACHISGK